MLERAVELGKVNLSEDDPDVLRTAYELGVLLQRSDDPAGARRVLEEAYAAGLWRLGDSDPLMLEISAGIGLAADELGNRHEARKAFGRVAEHGPRVLGGDHWAIARARGYLGRDQDPFPVRLEAPPPSQPTSAKTQSTPPQPHSATPPSLIAPRSAQPMAAGPQVPSRPAPPRSAPPPVGRSLRGADAPTVQLPVQAAVEEPAPERDALNEPTAALRVIAPKARSGTPEPDADALNGPTAALPVVAPVARRSTVEPPSAANQHVWVPPGRVGDRPQPIASGAGSALPAARRRGGRRAYGKWLGVIAVVLVAVVAVVALVHRTGDAGTEPNVPTLGGAAPGDVRLRDSGTEIGLSWQDPSEGTVSFMVTMGHPGELLKAVATLGPGTISYSVGALSVKMNYCFTVVAVYRQDRFATSPQVCTSRAPATPR